MTSATGNPPEHGDFIFLICTILAWRSIVFKVIFSSNALSCHEYMIFSDNRFHSFNRDLAFWVPRFIVSRFLLKFKCEQSDLFSKQVGRMVTLNPSACSLDLHCFVMSSVTRTHVLQMSKTWSNFFPSFVTLTHGKSIRWHALPAVDLEWPWGIKT